MDYFNAPSEACKPPQMAGTAPEPKGNRTAPDLGHLSIYYTSQKGVENAGKAKSLCITMGFCNAHRYTAPQRNQPKNEKWREERAPQNPDLKPISGYLEVSNV